MLYSHLTPAAKRRAFREALAGPDLLRLPGAFNPLSAKLIQDKGFDGVYVSGAVLSADLGLPDIGLTTLTEVAGRAGQIARVTDLPVLAADLGLPDIGLTTLTEVAGRSQQISRMTVPSVRVISTDPPKAFSEMSREW